MLTWCCLEESGTFAGSESETQTPAPRLPRRSRPRAAADEPRSSQRAGSPRRPDRLSASVPHAFRHRSGCGGRSGLRGSPALLAGVRWIGLREPFPGLRDALEGVHQRSGPPRGFDLVGEAALGSRIRSRPWGSLLVPSGSFQVPFPVRSALRVSPLAPPAAGARFAAKLASWEHGRVHFALLSRAIGRSPWARAVLPEAWPSLTESDPA